MTEVRRRGAPEPADQHATVSSSSIVASLWFDSLIGGGGVTLAESTSTSGSDSLELSADSLFLTFQSSTQLDRDAVYI